MKEKKKASKWVRVVTRMKVSEKQYVEALAREQGVSVSWIVRHNVLNKKNMEVKNG